MKRIIKGRRDSLGVPLEPDEEMPVSEDYKGDPLYPGDECIVIDGDLVRNEKEELLQYLKCYEKIMIGGDFDESI